MSYIDAKWEEPELRSLTTLPQQREQNAKGWIAQRVAAFRAWRLERRAQAELGNMTDRELMDIGLNRGDLMRVFNPAQNADLRGRAQYR